MEKVKEQLKKIKFSDAEKTLLDEILEQECPFDMAGLSIICKYNLSPQCILAYLQYSLDYIPKNPIIEVQEIYERLKKCVTFSHSKEDESETIRKMFVSMAGDLTIIILKLCTILDEISQYKEPISDSQRVFLLDVREIFAPLSERLGLNSLKAQLEDICLKFLNPKEYKYLKDTVALKREENDKQLLLTQKRLQNILDELKIKGSITARQKHLSSIHKKMSSQNIPLAKIYDLIAMRVIVETIEECYAVLGKIHGIYKPMDGRFKDYIASPKPNGYQSLHTTIITENNRPMEVQIRTKAMHKESEFGSFAAHWMYKEKRSKQTTLDKKFAWIREILDSSNDMSNQEFVETLKINLYGGRIFVQTPKGKVIEFPENSCVVDFAYAIHSDVGNFCIGGKVNGKMKPLSTKLKNGDIVEIITSSNSKGPSRDWLKIVKTAEARSKINAFFRHELKEENIKMGYSILEQAIKAKNLSPSKLLMEEKLLPLCRRFAFNTIQEMYAGIGYGSFSSSSIVAKLVEMERADATKISLESKDNLVVKEGKDGVLVDGDTGMLVRYARCCQASVGDDIVGYVSRGRGVTIHRKDCINVQYLESERLINAEWEVKDFKGKVVQNYLIVAKTGSEIMAKITKVFFDNGMGILKLDTYHDKTNITINIKAEARSSDQHRYLYEKLNKMDEIKDLKKA